MYIVIFLVDLLYPKVLLFIFFTISDTWLVDFQMVLLFNMFLSVCLVYIYKVKELLAKLKVSILVM